MPDTDPRRALPPTAPRRRPSSAAGARVALAGCARATSDRGGTRICGTSRVGEGTPGELIQQVDVRPGDTAVLRVVLNRDAAGFDALDRLLVFGADGELRCVIPREPVGPTGRPSVRSHRTGWSASRHATARGRHWAR